MKELWWECPKCERKVNFSKQLEGLFNKNGEALFEPALGLGWDVISCECGAKWKIIMGKVFENDFNET